ILNYGKTQKLCVYVVLRYESSILYTGTRFKSGCEMSHESWELSPGFLEELRHLSGHLLGILNASYLCHLLLCNTKRLYRENELPNKLIFPH
ncbi:mCG1045915, partial [Mus musculus]